MAGSILIVEDDRAYRAVVVRYLQRLQFTILEAADTESAVRVLDKHPVDVVLLDIGLGMNDALRGTSTTDGQYGASGYALIETIRSRVEYPSILVITSFENMLYEIAALQAGADAFLRKGLEMEVLVAHIKRCLRRVDVLGARQATGVVGDRNAGRPGAAPTQLVQFGDLYLDEQQQLLRILDGDYIHLSSREVQLLQLLARNPRKVFSKHELLENLWGPHAKQSYDSVTTLIKGLRRKIETKGSKQIYILTVHGRGYRFSSARPVAQNREN